MEVKYTRTGRVIGKYKANGKEINTYLGGRKLIYKKSWYSHQVPQKDCKWLHYLLSGIHPKLAKLVEEPYYASEYVVFYNPYKSVIDNTIRSSAYGKKNTPYSNVWMLLINNPSTIAEVQSRCILGTRKVSSDPKLIKMLNQEATSFTIDEAPF